jgi:hypothetical protein
MIKKKGKVIVEELVVYDKPTKKHPASKVKKVQKML